MAPFKTSHMTRISKIERVELSLNTFRNEKEKRYRHQEPSWFFGLLMKTKFWNMAISNIAFIILYCRVPFELF